MDLNVINHSLQIRLEARDGGTPNKVAIKVLTVTVKRNFLAPMFTSLSYEKTILENHPVASKVLTVFATDGDLTVTIISLLWISVSFNDWGTSRTVNQRMLADKKYKRNINIHDASFKKNSS